MNLRRTQTLKARGVDGVLIVADIDERIPESMGNVIRVVRRMLFEDLAVGT